MFSKEERCSYHSHQLGEVICQLRFPEILKINAQAPVAFQEAVRHQFPRYAANAETIAPKVIQTPQGLKLQTPPTINNHTFVSDDGAWRINLTSGFISLSCSHYTGWENFARQLDLPLAAFIQTYQPAFFQRIGLRYMNFISRAELGLDGVPFSELIAPAYLGILGDDGIVENDAIKSSVDAEFRLHSGHMAKIHAGPGIVTRNGQTDKEVKFIFDQDLYNSTETPVPQAAGVLEALHRCAYPIFRNAITEKLHNSLEPEYFD